MKLLALLTILLGVLPASLTWLPLVSGELGTPPATKLSGLADHFVKEKTAGGNSGFLKAIAQKESLKTEAVKQEAKPKPLPASSPAP